MAVGVIAAKSQKTLPGLPCVNGKRVGARWVRTLDSPSTCVVLFAYACRLRFTGLPIFYYW